MRRESNMLEESPVPVTLRCGWHGVSKQGSNKNNVVECSSEEGSLLLSGPYGDDVAFLKESNDQILVGLSDGVSGNRHHGLDPYLFAHTLIMSCVEQIKMNSLLSPSSIRGLVHRAVRCVERRGVFGSATLCLLSIDKRHSLLRSLNIGDSGFLLIRQNELLTRSHPQYHRGSSPFQLAALPPDPCFTSNTTRLYQDKPSDGECIEYSLEPGDLLLIASDGLFDNLYEDLIVQLINANLDDRCSVDSLTRVCQMLVQSACHARIKRDDMLVLLLSVVACSPLSPVVLSSGSSSGTPSSSSDSSLCCMLVDEAEDSDDDSPLDLFIFED